MNVPQKQKNEEVNHEKESAIREKARALLQQ